jgi:hypothetical protein
MRPIGNRRVEPTAIGHNVRNIFSPNRIIKRIHSHLRVDQEHGTSSPRATAPGIVKGQRIGAGIGQTAGSASPTFETTVESVFEAAFVCSEAAARKGTTSRRRSYFTRLGDLPDCESANEVENCGNDGKDACPVEDNGEELQNKSR